MTDVSPNTWQSQGKTFAYQGHQIFYRDETAEEAGESPEVLVCVHGFPTSSWDWHLLWRTLTRRFRVIAPRMNDELTVSRIDRFVTQRQSSILASICFKLGYGC